MRRTLTILTVVAVAAPVSGLAAAHAYDGARDDLIADGVRIGGIEVGGLRAAAARERVRARLLGPLRRPLVIRVGERRYRIGAREAGIHANVATMVDEAVRAGRRGSLLRRTWRGLTGGPVSASITPSVGYSRQAVQRIVDRVRVDNSRDAVDARVAFSTRRLAVAPSHEGRAIDARGLGAAVRARIVSPTASREIAIRARTVHPSVATEQVAERYPVVLTVDRRSHRIRLFEGLRETRSYPIALGRAGLQTPAGLYNIQNKQVDPAWHVPNSDWAGELAGKVIPGGAPDNPLKARWMGVAAGVGVHGTADRDSIGTNASHGCIRMLVEDVTELYDEVPVGAPILIA